MRNESGRKGFIARMWSSLLGKLVLLAAGALIFLLVGVGGFTTVVESTNTLEFCTSCHSMSYNYAEYKETVHYSNKMGVRAICSDCHVPHKNWYSEMYRKFIAARDVWEEIVGDIDTREKFDAHRAEMAKREWARMKENNSAGCRNCHSFEGMNLEEQDKGAQSKHADAEAAGKTCIDCHKGIVHKLPHI